MILRQIQEVKVTLFLLPALVYISVLVDFLTEQKIFSEAKQTNQEWSGI